MIITLENILQANQRIAPYIQRTPVINSFLLNNLLGHEVFFKAENTQNTGAFKLRGVLNTLLYLIETNQKPKKLVAYSSGNHARAIAYAGKVFNIATEVYMHKSASLSKQKAVKELGANLIITEKRIEAEELARRNGSLEGNFFLHPSDNDLVIAGAATLSYEALHKNNNQYDAIFAACGGGALLSGTYSAVRNLNLDIKVYGCEPLIANDATISVKHNKITGFDESPLTIADGLRTLKVSERTFNYLKQLSGFFEIEERAIEYWTAWLNYLLKIPCEPTAAVAMAGAHQWLKQQSSRKKVLVILSGGNLDDNIKEILENPVYLNNSPGFY